MKKYILNTAKFLRRFKETSSTGIFLRLGLLFVLYPLGHYIPFFMEKVPFLASFMNHAYEFVSVFIVNVSIFVLQVVYPSIHVSTDFMIVIGGRDVLFLASPCTGVDPMLRMTFIFLFYPLAFRTKFWVLPLSLVIILIAATVHFIMLIPIAYQATEWFHFSHNWLSKVVFYGFYFMVWIIWENILKRENSRVIPGDKSFPAGKH